MATAEQIKSLISAHFGHEPERFTTLALQVAAYEARQGHSALATELRSLIDRGRTASPKVIHIQPDLSDLVLQTEPTTRLVEFVAPDSIRKRLERIIKEYRQQSKLKKYGLNHRRKLLLAGPPGTGKTMTASVLASQLKLPLCTIMMDKLVTKYMGETSAKLRQVFDMIENHKSVFLFDEFDAIGGERGKGNDVGEMRRVLNAFLQFIERDSSCSIIIAATNNIGLLDQALYRRFDDVLHYSLPDNSARALLIQNRLGSFRNKSFTVSKAAAICEGLSHSEISQACDDAIKEAILEDRKSVTLKLMQDMLQERKAAYGQFFKMETE